MARRTEHNPNRDALLGQLVERACGMATADIVALLAGLPKPVTFSEDEWTVMKVLKLAHPKRLTLRQIAARSRREDVEISVTGAHRAVMSLEQSGTAERPEGDHHGLALSPRGFAIMRDR